MSLDHRILPSEETSEADERYREAFHASGAIKRLSDPETGRIVDVNQAACDFYGLPREELIGTAVSDMNALTPEELQREKDRAREQKRHFFLTRHRLGSGEIRDVEIYSSPIHIDGKRYLHAIINDITPRTELEQELATTKERLEVALEAGAVGVWEVDFVRQRAWRSSRHAAIFGYDHPSESWSYGAFMGHVVPSDRSLVNRRVESGIASGDPFHFECRIRRVDGEVRWIEVSGKVRKDEGGDPVRLTGTVRDVTKRKEGEELFRKAKEEAERATRLKDRFLSLVAHDLRNPLSSVQGLLHMLGKDAKRDEESQKRLIDGAINGVVRAIAIMEDLLNVGRFKTGAMNMKVGPTPLYPLVEQVFDDHRPMADAKGMTLANRLAASTTVMGDQTLVEVILQNLVGNAIKFGKKGGRVSVAMAPGILPTLAVFDDGVGIPDAALEHLFVYESAYSTVGTSGEKGTGLGLPLCLDMMRTMGGDLKVVSVEGEGTLFYVGFPAPSSPVLKGDE